MAAAISPNYATDQTVVVGTLSQGVYHSTDGGRAWVQCDRGLTELAVTGVGISPDYALDRRIVVGTPTVGIFRSWGGGDTWQLRNVGQTIRASPCLPSRPLCHRPVSLMVLPSHTLLVSQVILGQHVIVCDWLTRVLLHRSFALPWLPCVTDNANGQSVFALLTLSMSDEEHPYGACSSGRSYGGDASRRV